MYRAQWVELRSLSDHTEFNLPDIIPDFAARVAQLVLVTLDALPKSLINIKCIADLNISEDGCSNATNLQACACW